MQPARNPWLPYTRPRPETRLRLFCYPYAGGSASAFGDWAAGLRAEIQVCPVQLPGRETRFREAPFTRLEPLLDSLAQALEPHFDLPFAFFGHSMGALIGFELTRLLRRQGRRQPVHLFVAGRNAPQTATADRERVLLHQMGDALLIARIRTFGGMPEMAFENDELMELLVPIYRADFSVNETYVHSSEAPLACPISAFGGLDDPEVSRTDLMAWGVQTAATFKPRLLPGNHFFLHDSSALLLQAIREDLAPFLD